MRIGDFSLEILPSTGSAAEQADGTVLCQHGQQYRIRLMNHGKCRAVAEVTIDGICMTPEALVVPAGGFIELERPVHPTENGRFTFFREGSEDVFGEDGGRTNVDLGLVKASFRKEINLAGLLKTTPSVTPQPLPYWGNPRPYWDTMSPVFGARNMPQPSISYCTNTAAQASASVGAGGTGLTGESAQQFVPVAAFPLESSTTVLCLRLVEGVSVPRTAPRPLPQPRRSGDVPPRPVARP